MRNITGAIAALLAAGAVTIGAAPIAAASTASTVHTPGNAQLVATPGGVAQAAAQLQQPFGGDYGALLFRHR
jgi:hypothetical protein